MFLDKVAHMLHHVNLRRKRGLGLATFARPKACLLSGIRCGEKDHLFTSRPARGTRRAAVHARRANTVDKRTIQTCVASEHRLPERLFVFHHLLTHLFHAKLLLPVPPPASFARHALYLTPAKGRDPKG